MIGLTNKSTIIQLLLEASVDSNARNDDGRTPVVSALVTPQFQEAIDP